MVAKVFLDTETSGLNVEEGHRIIEIGATVVDGGLHTGEEFHELLNPEREIDREASEVHGFTLSDLRDKPSFGEVADRFLDFIAGKDVYIHNATFDVTFIDSELSMTGQSEHMADVCTIHDTMDLAKKVHRGGLINLDSLCSKYGVDKTERDKHGALLDAQLLSEVYLRMIESTESLLGLSEEEKEVSIEAEPITFARTNIRVVKATTEELEAHNEYLTKLRDMAE